MAAQSRLLPLYVQREFEDYLKCGRLEHGFLRVQCDTCHAEHLVAFSCKRRGFCPSCGARRMAESAARLVDEVLPHELIRQWVLSFPFQLRFLFASYPEIMSKVLSIVYRAIATHLIKKAGFTNKTARTGAVTLIQRFGSALNLNVHFHMLFLDGVYAENQYGKTCFYRVKAPCLGGCGEVVADGETGYLFESRNIDDLASKMKMILKDSTFKELGVASRIRVEENFSRRQWVDGDEKIYLSFTS